MVAPGNVNPTGIRAPPGQGQLGIKAAATVGAPCGSHQAAPKMTSLGKTAMTDQVLHQTSKPPVGKKGMLVGGFAAVMAMGYFALYLNKKPEATATDVAKVVTATAEPKDTHPRK